MKKTLFLLALGLSVIFQLTAQSKLSLENVRSIYIRSNGSIMEGEELKGYFVFYVSDKIDKHTDEYTLQIMDNNLNKIKDIKFEDDKNIQILESSYNGNRTNGAMPCLSKPMAQRGKMDRTKRCSVLAIKVLPQCTR